MLDKKVERQVKKFLGDGTVHRYLVQYMYPQILLNTTLTGVKSIVDPFYSLVFVLPGNPNVPTVYVLKLESAYGKI
jgi:hypothetical protein